MNQHVDTGRSAAKAVGHGAATAAILLLSFYAWYSYLMTYTSAGYDRSWEPPLWLLTVPFLIQSLVILIFSLGKAVLSGFELRWAIVSTSALLLMDVLCAAFCHNAVGMICVLVAAPFVGCFVASVNPWD